MVAAHAQTGRMARVRTAAAAATLLLTLTACFAAEDPTPPGAGPATGVPLLAAHGLGEMTGREIVDHLDRLGGADRPSDLLASVRPDGLVLTDGTEEIAVELPEFYLSLAPYVDSTHECYYHSLTTCQGELVEEEVEVTFTTDDGEVLVDETTTTFANGFVGYWLPPDVEGTLVVSHDGRSGTLPVSTGADDPTCLTTLQLS